MRYSPGDVTDAYSSTREPFPFLELPREIRDQIYFYVCGGLALLPDLTSYRTKPHKPTSAISLSTKISAPKEWRVPNIEDWLCAPSKYWPVLLNALSVSRQVHDEAALVFYSSSIFRIRKMDDFHSFTNRIRPELRAQIRRLEFNFNSFHLREWKELLKFTLPSRFQSLRYLKIVLSEYDKPDDFRKLQDRQLGGHRSVEVSILASDYKSLALRERDEENARVIIGWLEHSLIDDAGSSQ